MIFPNTKEEFAIIDLYNFVKKHKPKTLEFTLKQLKRYMWELLYFPELGFNCSKLTIKELKSRTFYYRGIPIKLIKKN